MFHTILTVDRVHATPLEVKAQQLEADASANAAAFAANSALSSESKDASTVKEPASNSALPEDNTSGLQPVSDFLPEKINSHPTPPPEDSSISATAVEEKAVQPQEAPQVEAMLEPQAAQQDSSTLR